MIELPIRNRAWTDEDLAIVAELHGNVSCQEIARTLGRSAAAVRNCVHKRGLAKRDDAWSDADLDTLRAVYAGAPRRGELDLNALSAKLKRSKPSISRKARSLGLTDNCRKGVPKPKIDKRKYKTEEDLSRARSETLIQRHRSTPHPMRGRKHSPESRAKIGTASQKAWAAASVDQRSSWSRAILESRLKSQGTLAPPRPHASWKAGWREIGGKRNYYRSRWEANYARYLEWLRVRGDIADWKHEPETFWFDAIKRGVRSYLPDFRVWDTLGDSVLHEVKGWMDSRSKTTLRRMAKYHPQEKIVVIRERQYNEIARKLSPLIEGWETSERVGRW